VPATKRLLVSLLTLPVLVGLPLQASQDPPELDPPAEDTIEFFAQECASCHTIGGGVLTGPDLKNVSQIDERDWLIRFIKDPEGMIESGDPRAVELFQEAGGRTVMTTIVGMDDELAGKLIDLIDYESTLEKSRFIGLQLSDRALTEKDIADGREYFLGTKSFAEGAPACVSCHTVEGLAGFGGGRLGPDLTAAFARLEGRKVLGAWLSAPPVLPMRPVFKNKNLESEEILALLAFLKDAAESGEQEAESSTLEFVLAGIGLAALLLIIADLIWRGRFRAVRRPLVANH